MVIAYIITDNHCASGRVWYHLSSYSVFPGLTLSLNMNFSFILLSCNRDSMLQMLGKLTQCFADASAVCPHPGFSLRSHYRERTHSWLELRRSYSASGRNGLIRRPLFQSDLECPRRWQMWNHGWETWQRWTAASLLSFLPCPMWFKELSEEVLTLSSKISSNIFVIALECLFCY